MFVLFAGGCFANIRGTVLDAETGKPVEGAVAGAEWHLAKGLPGLTYTDLYKSAETVTDENGKFSLPGVANPFVKLRFVIYKKGYVAWREFGTFPDYTEREKLNWKRHNVFRLERFVRGAYSHSDHIMYIERGLIELGSSSKLGQAYEWECTMERKEHNLYWEKRHSPAGANKSSRQLDEEVLKELYLQKKDNRNE